VLRFHPWVNVVFAGWQDRKILENDDRKDMVSTLIMPEEWKAVRGSLEAPPFSCVSLSGQIKDFGCGNVFVRQAGGLKAGCMILNNFGTAAVAICSSEASKWICLQD